MDGEYYKKHIIKASETQHVESQDSANRKRCSYVVFSASDLRNHR